MPGSSEKICPERTAGNNSAAARHSEVDRKICRCRPGRSRRCTETLTPKLGNSDSAGKIGKLEHRVGKRRSAAVEFLRNVYPESEISFCGDSGNNLSGIHILSFAHGKRSDGSRYRRLYQTRRCCRAICRLCGTVSGKSGIAFADGSHLFFKESFDALIFCPGIFEGGTCGNVGIATAHSGCVDGSDDCSATHFATRIHTGGKTDYPCCRRRHHTVGIARVRCCSGGSQSYCEIAGSDSVDSDTEARGNRRLNYYLSRSMCMSFMSFMPFMCVGIVDFAAPGFSGAVRART